MALLRRLLIYLSSTAVIVVIFGYIALCVTLYTMQVHLIYPGANQTFTGEEAAADAKRFGVAPWGRLDQKEDTYQGFIDPDFTQASQRGTIVFFHGNGEVAWEHPGCVEAWKRRGFRTFLYEYPGYGGRPGHPREATIVPDAQALIRSLDQAGFGPIYVWGTSLGSGVAAAACADPSLPVHGLVLMAAFDSLTNVGLSRYWFVPVPLLMNDRYDSVAHLQHFGHPICVIRGDLDMIIPARLTLNLFAHLPDPKKMIVEKGYGHGDWPSSPDLAWWDVALDFIAPQAQK